MYCTVTDCKKAENEQQVVKAIIDDYGYEIDKIKIFEVQGEGIEIDKINLWYEEEREKNLEKKIEEERQEYERLKAKFEK